MASDPGLSLEQAHRLADIAVRSAKERGCNCQPHVAVQAVGPLGHPAVYLGHEDACSLEVPAQPTLIMGTPNGAELN